MDEHQFMLDHTKTVRRNTQKAHYIPLSLFLYSCRPFSLFIFSPFPSVCRFFRPNIFDRQEIFHFFPLLDIKMGCNGQMGRGEEIIITNMRKLYVRYEADLIMINEDLKS